MATNPQTFNDGVVEIYAKDETGSPAGLLLKARFEERVVGINRLYAAAQVQAEISRLIRIPQNHVATTNHLAVVGGDTYEITQCRLLDNQGVKVAELTLRKIDRTGGEAGDGW